MADSYWTDARIEALKGCLGDGHSAGEIARRIGAGCTRNMVLGKVYRLGLGFRDRPHEAKSEDIQKRIADRKQRQALPKPRLVVPPSPKSPNPTVMTLKFGQCRWPLDMGVKCEATAESLFCGAAVRDEACPYCAPHARRAYAGKPAAERPVDPNRVDRRKFNGFRFRAGKAA